MAKKFVQTYQVSFAKSLDISKDYKKKKKLFPELISSFLLEIKPKELFSSEDYLIPLLLPYNLDPEVYEKTFKETFEILKDSERVFKTKFNFWTDGYFALQVEYPSDYRLTKLLRPLRSSKTSRKKKKAWKALLTKFFFFKRYGDFSKKKNRLQRIRKKFRRKILSKQKRVSLGIYEKMTNPRMISNFIKNISLSRGFGDHTKSFFFKKAFNSYLGWNKSKVYDIQLKLGEVV